MQPKKAITLITLLSIGCGTLSAPPPEFTGHIEQCGFVDLTHPFGKDTLHWPTQKPFKKTLFGKGYNDTYGWYYSAYDIETAEHTGTHLDAPVHFYEGMQSTDEIPLTQLMGEACVLDVRRQAAADGDYEISREDFERWERMHGSLDDCIVLAYTGHEHYWHDRVRYFGGWDAEATGLHFPGFHGPSVKWLVTNRRIRAVGIDTASTDRGQSRSFSTHVELCQRNIPGLENVNNISQLPARGATLIALPMKIAGGSGGPVRIVAFGIDRMCRRRGGGAGDFHTTVAGTVARADGTTALAVSAALLAACMARA